MNARAAIACGLALGAVALATSANAQSVDPSASVVHLEKDCSGLSDCFEDTPALLDWIEQTRLPSEDAPLRVQVGPGRFTRFLCNGWGHVTVHGAGRTQTTFFGVNGANITNCGPLEFSKLSMLGTTFGVAWFDGGRSIWSDVDIRGSAIGWYDVCDAGTLKGLHYFMGVRIWGAPAYGTTRSMAFLSSCGEDWVIGSEIAVRSDPDRPLAVLDAANAVVVQDQGDVRLFGTVVRVDTRGMLQGAGQITGVGVGTTPANEVVGGATGKGVFHMHGGIIALAANGRDHADLIGIDVAPGAFAHTPDTAFALRRANNGTVQRIRGTSRSPFLWPAASRPPTAGDETNVLRSSDGMDLYVETDCDAEGSCDSAGSEPHLMIYAETHCGSENPWFNTVTRACRGALTTVSAPVVRSVDAPSSTDTVESATSETAVSTRKSRWRKLR